jgi:membrane-associated phospholipid phosphatase
LTALPREIYFINERGGEMKGIKSIQGLVERLFFRGQSSKASEALVYIVANLLLMGVVFYLVLNNIVYDWTGALYAKGFHLNTALDNIIPFRPEWAIFYLYLFYYTAELTMVFFAVFDYRRGYALAWSLVLINLVADLVYLVFPVTTDIYRAQIAAHPIVGSRFADAIYAYYAKDPSFDCFPSLHAAVSVICFYAWYRYSRIKPNAVIKVIAIVMFAVAVGVVLSTLFVKQHYIADEVAGIALALGIGKWVFDRAGRNEPMKSGRRDAEA